MEYNELKSIGKIYNFDGETGTIVTKDKEYIFNTQQVKNPQEINDNTLVSFYPSTIRFGNETFYIAREVETMQQEELKSLKKETSK